MNQNNEAMTLCTGVAWNFNSENLGVFFQICAAQLDPEYFLGVLIAR
jgi:hypothetical protein